MFLIIVGARESSLMLTTSPSIAPQISMLSTGTLGRQVGNTSLLLPREGLTVHGSAGGIRMGVLKGETWPATLPGRGVGLGPFLKVAV